MIAVYIIIALVAVSSGTMVIQNTRIPATIGVHDGQLSPVPRSPNAVSSQSDDATKLVEPLPLAGTVDASLDTIEQVVQSHEAEIVTRDGAYIHAVYRSELMRFRDDVEFLADADAAVIHFRSASRVGYGDMGVNRARYERIRADYEAATGGE